MQKVDRGILVTCIAGQRRRTVRKQSGVSEVLTHALKVDVWDINEMANKIIAVLKHPPLASTLRQHGSFEVGRMSWTDAARACVGVYEQAVGAMNGR